MCGAGGYEVANPSDQPPGADPEPRRDDEPEGGAKKLAVVDLTHAGNDEAQYGGHAGIFLYRARLKYRLAHL